MDPVAASLLDREEDVLGPLSQAVVEHGRSRTELTFNVTNVLIDFDSQTVTVDDELDPAVAATVPLADFRSWLHSQL